MGKTLGRHKTTETVLNNGWRLAAVGGWRLVAVGGWRLVAVGGWRLAVGGPWGLSLRPVLNNKKNWGALQQPSRKGGQGKGRVCSYTPHRTPHLHWVTGGRKNCRSPWA